MRTPLHVAALVLLAGIPLPAQTARNTRLLGAFTTRGGVLDLALVSDASGGSFAVLATSAGTSVVDCRVPGSPKETGFFPGPRTDWRRVARAGKYLYVASEGGPGLRILDLSSPLRPKLVKSWNGNLWKWAHGLRVSPDGRHLWVFGTDRGLLVLDIRRQPSNPILAAAWKGPWVADLLVHGDTAELAEPFAGTWTRLDLTRFPLLTKRVSVRTPLAFPRSFSLDDSGHLLVVEDHPAGGDLAIYDLSQPKAPKLLGRTRAASSSKGLAFGVEARKGLAFTAWGTEGLRIFDLLRPDRPTEIASYDTFPGASGGRHGASAVRRDPVSGRIFLADLDRGLFILESSTDRRLYGVGTPGYEDLVPELDFEGSSAAGRILRLDLRKAHPQAPLFLLLGTSKASLKLRELTILVDPRSALVLPAGSTDRGGAFRMDLSFPVSIGAGNSPLDLQFLVLDKLGSLGFAASRGLSLAVFRP